MARRLGVVLLLLSMTAGADEVSWTAQGDIFFALRHVLVSAGIVALFSLLVTGVSLHNQMFVQLLEEPQRRH